MQQENKSTGVIEKNKWQRRSAFRREMRETMADGRLIYFKKAKEYLGNSLSNKLMRSLLPGDNATFSSWSDALEKKKAIINHWRFTSLRHQCVKIKNRARAAAQCEKALYAKKQARQCIRQTIHESVADYYSLDHNGSHRAIRNESVCRRLMLMVTENELFDLFPDAIDIYQSIAILIWNQLRQPVLQLPVSLEDFYCAFECSCSSRQTTCIWVDKLILECPERHHSRLNQWIQTALQSGHALSEHSLIHQWICARGLDLPALYRNIQWTAECVQQVSHRLEQRINMISIIDVVRWAQCVWDQSNGQVIVNLSARALYKPLADMAGGIHHDEKDGLEPWIQLLLCCNISGVQKMLTVPSSSVLPSAWKRLVLYLGEWFQPFLTADTSGIIINYLAG